MCSGARCIARTPRDNPVPAGAGMERRGAAAGRLEEEQGPAAGFDCSLEHGTHTGLRDMVKCTRQAIKMQGLMSVRRKISGEVLSVGMTQSTALRG